GVVRENPDRGLFSGELRPGAVFGATICRGRPDRGLFLGSPDRGLFGRTQTGGCFRESPDRGLFSGQPSAAVDENRSMRARPVVERQSYMFTRRCSERRFFLRPDAETTNA